MGSVRLASRKGFTLIELLVVIAIIAILAAILFRCSRARERAEIDLEQPEAAGMGILVPCRTMKRPRKPRIRSPSTATSMGSGGTGASYTRTSRCSPAPLTAAVSRCPIRRSGPNVRITYPSAAAMRTSSPAMAAMRFGGDFIQIEPSQTIPATGERQRPPPLPALPCRKHIRWLSPREPPYGWMRYAFWVAT